MASCTFFGHRDSPSTIRPKLREVLTDLITNHNVDAFYVGHQGQYDALVRATLQELKIEYPHIDYTVVLAYMPGRKKTNDNDSDTMFPEGMESVPPRFAIARRNDWMLKRSDYVVTYITHSFGGAAGYASKALAAGKHLINLSNIELSH